MRLGDTACRVLGAVLTLHAQHGRVTVRDVADKVGVGSTVTHRHLRRLRAAGLVAWEADTNGTIRPTCTVVSHAEHACAPAATLSADNLSGRGVALTTPGLAGRWRSDMAGLYPGTPTHAQGRR